MTKQKTKNVLGTALTPCCTEPPTGYFRDGFCRTDDQDHGRHVVCAFVTQDFLDFPWAKEMTSSPPNRTLIFPD